MEILGTGIDIIEISRIARVFDRKGNQFLNKVYSPGEQKAMAGTSSRKSYIEKLAARFASKEAVMKALGTGWRQGVAWREIEVEHLTTGRPVVRLSGRTAALAEKKGIARIEITMSHNNETAIAYAMALGLGQG